MKQNEVKVSFYLKKSETNDAGRCPVMAQLSIGKYADVAFSAKIVPVSLWSSRRAAGKSREAAEINSQLDEMWASALSFYRELSSRREQVTAEDVRSALLGMVDVPFSALYKFFVRSRDEPHAARHFAPLTGP